MTTTNGRVRFTAPEGERVPVRVLPQGAGRVFTGEADEAAGGFATYERGAVFSIEPAVAAELEARGLVEIQP